MRIERDIKEFLKSLTSGYRIAITDSRALKKIIKSDILFFFDMLKITNLSIYRNILYLWAMSILEAKSMIIGV